MDYKKENSHKPQAPTTEALCLLAAMSFCSSSWVKELSLVWFLEMRPGATSVYA